jgi:hypothetical protein
MFVDEIPSYRTQYTRMMRWYDKFQRLYKDFTGREENIDEYFDIAYAFFTNCYHFKDWIRNDPMVKISDDDVERYITDNQCLSICDDICNGIKHLRLDRPKSDQKPKMETADIYDAVGPCEDPHRIIPYIDTMNNRSVDPFELATECVKRWQEFLRQRGLI